MNQWFGIGPDRADSKNVRTPPFLTGDSDTVINGQSFGQKALIANGGMINIKSAYCGTPTWTQLETIALPGDTLIQTRMNVKGRWKEGSQLIITATGYDRDESEVFSCHLFYPFHFVYSWRFNESMNE